MAQNNSCSCNDLPCNCGQSDGPDLSSRASRAVQPRPPRASRSAQPRPPRPPVELSRFERDLCAQIARNHTDFSELACADRLRIVRRAFPRLGDEQLGLPGVCLLAANEQDGVKAVVFRNNVKNHNGPGYFSGPVPLFVNQHNQVLSTRVTAPRFRAMSALVMQLLEPPAAPLAPVRV